MADRGDVGAVTCFVPLGLSLFAAVHPWSRFGNKNTAAISGAAADTVLRLTTERGLIVGFARSDGSGDAEFYDLDDGTYYVHETGSASAWEVAVAGALATVTPLNTSGTVGFAFIA